MRKTKREHLLRVAERLFYEEGFHATGIDRIVTEAGVTRMTLYNHFASKTELIRGVLAARHDRYRRALCEAIEARGQESALGALVAVQSDWLRARAQHGCMVIKAIAEFQRHDSAIAADALVLKRDLLGIIDWVLELDGIARRGAAQEVLMVLEGSNALVPVLGLENVLSSMQSLLSSWLVPAQEASA